MQIHKLSHILHKLNVGMRCRCPECERGAIFQDRFHMHDKCAYCGVRFERGSGDAIGGVYINVAAAEITAMTGFFLLHHLLDLPIVWQMMIWIPYVLVFCVLFYRYARGIWVGVMYLTGGIYPDFDYEKEYQAPSHMTYGRASQKYE